MGHLQKLVGLFGGVSREPGVDKFGVHVSDEGVWGSGLGARIGGCRGWGREGVVALINLAIRRINMLKSGMLFLVINARI